MHDLVRAAREAAAEAYVPYSEFPVGAAVETTGGDVYTGCNVETVDYAGALHAEEVAVGAAVSDGARRIERVAVSAAERPGLAPCGSCRQTLSEFGGESTTVLCDEGEGEAPSEYALGALLPVAMGPADLGVEP